MRVSPNWLYLHPPKTGGWTVRRILEAARLGELPQGIHQHSALHELRTEFSGRPFIFATVREPCAWWRSYLHYNTDRNGYPKPALRSLIGGARLDLKKALRLLLFPRPGTIEAIPVFGVRTPAPVSALEAHHIGPYSWMLIHMLRIDPVLPDLNSAERLFDVNVVMDTDWCRTGLQVVMSELGYDIQQALQDTPDDNRNEVLTRTGRDIFPYEGTTAEVFDEEMREWVYELEDPIVQLMGYDGPGQWAQRPLVRSP